MLVAPMALVAVAVGFAAQGLAPQPYGAAHGELLDALIDTPAPAADTASEAAELRRVEARRAAVPDQQAAPGKLGLVEPEAGPPVDLEIRVALLNAGANPTLSASGAWQLLNREGMVLQQGGPGDQVSHPALGSSESEAWLQTNGSALLVNGQPYGGRLRLIREQGGLRLVNHLGLEIYIAAVVGAEMPSSW